MRRVSTISRGYLVFKASPDPKYRLAVEESITSTMVAKTHMDASPAPFLFMRYTMDDTDTKWLGL